MTSDNDLDKVISDLNELAKTKDLFEEDVESALAEFGFDADMEVVEYVLQVLLDNFDVTVHTHEEDLTDICIEDQKVKIGGHSNDPMNIYIKDMVSVPMLPREKEIALSKDISHAQKELAKVFADSMKFIRNLYLLYQKHQNQVLKMGGMVSGIHDFKPSSDEEKQKEIHKRFRKFSNYYELYIAKSHAVLFI